METIQKKPFKIIVYPMRFYCNSCCYEIPFTDILAASRHVDQGCSVDLQAFDGKVWHTIASWQKVIT